MPIIKYAFLILSLVVCAFLFTTQESQPVTYENIHYSKTYGTFLLQIDTIELKEGYAVLEANIRVQENISDFDLEWILPANAQIISGDLNQNINTYHGKNHLIRIHVEWPTWEESDKILVHVENNNTGRTISWKPSRAVVKEDDQKSGLSIFSRKPKKKELLDLPPGMRVMQ